MLTRAVESQVDPLPPKPEAPDLQDAIAAFTDRMKRAGGELTHERRPVQNPDNYLDQENVPREGYGATAMKNGINAFMEAQPDNSIPAGGGRSFDPTAAIGSLKNEFRDSHFGRLIGNEFKPWELTPNEYAQKMKQVGEGLNFDPRRLEGIHKIGAGALTVDQTKEFDPKKIIEILSKKAGIEAPSFTQLDQDNAGIGPNVSAWYARTPHAITFNGYPLSDHVNSFPKQLQQYRLPELANHEMEHAIDAKSPNRTMIPELSRENQREFFDSNFTSPGSLYGINDLGQQRLAFLKSKGFPVPQKYAPADFTTEIQRQVSNNEISREFPQNIQKFKADNPFDYQRFKSLGHFKTIGNFETEYPLRELARQALQERMDINPAILQAFPELADVKPQGRSIDDISPGRANSYFTQKDNLRNINPRR